MMQAGATVDSMTESEDEIVNKTDFASIAECLYF